MAADIPSRRRKRTNSAPKPAHKVISFDDGTDFISLDVEFDEQERDSQTPVEGKQRQDVNERERKRPRVEQTAGGFDDGTEFISLDAVDSSVDDNWKRKSKDRQHSRERRRSRSRSPRRRTDDRRGRDGDPERQHDHGREWDHGKPKYDMVFDFNESSRRQRTEPHGRLTPWVETMDWKSCTTPAELFHCEMENFVKWISPTPQEDEIRGLVVDIISRLVTKQFADAQVLPFGSYATKLYLPLGDIDLVIRSPSMAYANAQSVLSSLAAIVRRSGLTDGKVTVIAKAKVPIIKFITTAEYGRFNVDVSINQDNGLVAGDIINNFLRTTSTNGTALRALVLLTKLFLAQRQMNEVYSGGLGSYAIVCMCISFLQMHPKVRFGQIDPDKNLGVLVLEFFELYGHRFHYDEVGISLRNGGCYFGKRQRGWGDVYGGNRRASVLSIEDPGDPSNDISSGSYNFRTVRQNLAGAHDILLAAVYKNAGILEARQNGTAVRLRDTYDRRDTTILGAMLGVTQETINNRRLVQEVYDSQALHKYLGVEPKIILPPVSDSAGAAPSDPSSSPIVNGESPRKKRSKRKSKKTKSSTVIVVHADANGSVAGSSKPQSQVQPRATSVSVQEVWAAADAEPDVVGLEAKEEGDEADDGRYSVGRLPPKKRQRRGGAGRYGDEGIVTFTIDSDEEDSDTWAGKKGKTPVREKPPSRKGMGNRTTSASSLGSAERRDFWLSKGIGPDSSASDE
ncbi:hypothetical protein MKEN_00063500 [Mycena kentingensis (nom. inval.)]|nr:hypothetical protein MKEN_00063500 [Mycena kentingensis (nom. inval.)]